MLCPKICNVFLSQITNKFKTTNVTQLPSPLTYRLNKTLLPFFPSDLRIIYKLLEVSKQNLD